MPFLSDRVKREFLDSCATIRHGSLRLKTPEGEIHDFGAGAPEAALELHDWSAVTAAAARGDVGFGEAYVEGLWDTPSIETLTQVALMNLQELSGFAYAGFWQSLKFRLVDRLLRRNSARGAARNIRAHYDVGNEFYQLWLDPGMTYSSALFAEGETDLARAQDRKYDRILSRLGEGERVLEIGCGWGGFAERAADHGRDVTALTISPSQKAYADARLDGRAEIRLEDYRHTKGLYDNIVSIEMIEAVGEAYWPAYFATLKARMAEGGRAVVQAITVPDGYFDVYRRSSDFIRQYTFPGGMLLSNAQIARHARDAGLAVRDVFSFGGDYARTCATWGERLDAEAGRIRRMGFDDRFLRSWRYYLGICAASFAVRQTDVVQVELAHA
ncbi:cyclopropane-fatty-acyl-phospholipid synthase [Psychromarinibacter sp. C21-152]|uniref:Cyclopropane-fatty-acyl-phospholipid synthase n=1 Tax=Psychromarinibacter sediminicola TaxID=3033385 RepID=A0AAE3NRI7_9RHOB|nr:cyclopropane-fatty-acyl-phospholipid synthase family protein [Psychromarinibacter sediminicola]MDF0601116.1 cyclopropane-fatty-acyl-phospholipid synthase [Psychromarinibacter sediminicola]